MQNSGLILGSSPLKSDIPEVIWEDLAARDVTVREMLLDRARSEWDLVTEYIPPQRQITQFANGEDCWSPSPNGNFTLYTFRPLLYQDNNGHQVFHC